MELIDKAAILAEIERLEKKNKKSEYVYDSLDTEYTLKSIISFINTLEVKEVDLEKEIKESITDEWCDEWSSDVGNWIRCRRGTTSMTVENVEDIAKYFFELGLKAQKGE